MFILTFVENIFKS